MKTRRTAWAALALLLGAACSSSERAAPAVATPAPASGWRATLTREVEVGPRYRQGLARVEDGWIFSFNDGLYRTDPHDVQTAALEPAIPAEWKARGYNHIGDIDVVDGVLYAPLEQPDYGEGRQAMLLYDAATLEFRSGFEVAQHENSFVTIDPATRIAYSLDNFGGDALLRYDVAADWKLLEPLRMSTFVDKVQGADVAEGAIWLASDDERKGLYRVDLSTGRVDELGSIGHLDGEAEGIDATRGPSGPQLRVLSIDAREIPVRAIDVSITPPAS
jgi:hypothetical protein